MTTPGTTSSVASSTPAVVFQAIMLRGKENYEEWMARVRMNLLSQNLWQDVQETDEPFPGRQRENFMALHVIQNSCGPEPFSMIKDITNARKAWRDLAHKYSGSTGQGHDQNNNFTKATRLEDLLRKNKDLVSSNDKKLYKAVRDGKLEETQGIIQSRKHELIKKVGANHDDIDPKSLHEALMNGKIGCRGETALHIAVINGHEDIVKELVENQMSDVGLEIHDSDGYTALITAAMLGNKTMVDCMLKKHPNLISITDLSKEKNLPVVIALSSRQIEMGRHLFSRINAQESTEERDRNDATILTRAIYAETLDIALELIRRKPSLALTLDKYEESPILALASMPHSFPSGNQLCTAANNLNDSNGEQRRKSNQEDQNNRLALPNTGDIHLNVSNGEQHQSNQDQEKNNRSVICKQLLEMKKIHVQSDKLLSQIMCKVISKSTEQELENGLVFTAITRAAKNGIFEFVSKMLEMDRRFLWTQDRYERNIFMIAVLHRQEKIFNILYRLDGKMYYLLTSKDDVNGNNMLHMAAMIEDSTWVNKIPGAALQMQRELQWFKEVEGIVHPKAKESTNGDGLTPRQLFMQNHKNLMKMGEEWMKVTATSYIVVAILIVTIMFAAAITIPGGNDEKTGFPKFKRKPLFMLFIICDALSFSSSLISMLMFLGILTSSYAEEDFLKYLPRQMILGLSTLFCSIATMMITFSTAVIILLHHQYSWILFPIIALACAPVILFVFMHLIPLFKIMVVSTYGRGIFDKKWKRERVRAKWTGSAR